ncbi:MAG: hypothetical protein ACOY3P_15640 [Planctomycetota bacterium]
MVTSLGMLGLLLVSLLAAIGIGRPIWRSLRLPVDAGSDLLWSIALGIMVLGLALPAAAAFGLVAVPGVIVVTIVAALWGAADLIHVMLGWLGRDAHARQAESCEPVPRLAVWLDFPERQLRKRERRKHLLAWSPVVVLALLALVRSMVPPTGTDLHAYDAAHRSLIEQRLVAADDGCAWMVQGWCIWCLALGGAALVRLFFWAVMVLGGAAAYMLAEPIGGRRVAAIAAGLTLLTPGLALQSAGPSAIAPAALLTSLAAVACWRAIVALESDRWFLVAGAMVGGVIALGQPAAVLFLMAAAAGWSVPHWKEAMRRPWLRRGWACSTAVAICIGGVSIAAPHVERGPVVSPSRLCRLDATDQSDLSGRSAPGLPLSARRTVGQASCGARTGLSASNAGKLLFGHPLARALAHQVHLVGALLIAGIPGLWAARRLRNLGPILAGLAVATVVYVPLAGDIKIVLALMPAAAVAVAWSAAEMEGWPAWPRRLAFAAVALAGLAALAIPMRHAAGALPTALGWVDRESYLVGMEPSFPAAEAANRLLPPEAKLLSQAPHALYLKVRSTPEREILDTELFRKCIDAPERVAKTLAAAGFSHVLLMQPEADGAAALCPNVMAQLIEAQIQSQPDAATVFTQYRHKSLEGNIVRVRLIALNAAAP